MSIYRLFHPLKRRYLPRSIRRARRRAYRIRHIRP